MSSPPLFVVFAVAGPAVLVMCDRLDPALDDPQARAIRLGGEDELDQRGVVLIGPAALRVAPAEAEAAGGLGLHDADRHDHAGSASSAASGPPRERPVRSGVLL